MFMEEQGERGPLVVSIHWLGGSSHSWKEVGEGLARGGMRCVAVDLPGFGRSAEAQDFSTAVMVGKLVEVTRTLRKGETDGPWFLAGHSMGGKLAALVARAAEDGTQGLENLRGMVLLSPSPPGPEPMKESKREEMVQALGPKSLDNPKRRELAEKFVNDNTGRVPLADRIQLRTVEDVLRMNPDALVAWLDRGSREDWSGRVGVLKTHALVLAGTEEAALGPDAQAMHTLSHFENATLVPLKGGGHLAPLERPDEVVDRMLEFFRGLGDIEISGEASMSDRFRDLIESPKTSPQTRKVMMERLVAPSLVEGFFSLDERRLLRALAVHVIPGASFDLSRRLEEQLIENKGDGWRFAKLPPDQQAWKQGLFSLDAAAKREFGAPFVALDVARKDQLLKRACDGDLGAGVLATVHLGASAGAFDGEQMRDWFEEVRAALARIYVSDPRTMERMGFTGFADEQGFTEITLGGREEFEV